MPQLKTETFAYSSSTAPISIEEEIFFEHNNVIFSLEDITEEILIEKGFSQRPEGSRNRIVSLEHRKNRLIFSDAYDDWEKSLISEGFYIKSSNYWPAPVEYLENMQELAQELKSAGLKIKCIDVPGENFSGFMTPAPEMKYYTDVALAYIIAGYMPPSEALTKALKEPQPEDRAALLNMAREQAADHLIKQAQKLTAAEIEILPSPAGPRA